MPDRSIELLDFILCEDVRAETQGTHTLIGVFQDLVRTPVLPYALNRLAFYIRIAGLEEGTHPYQLQLIDDTTAQPITLSEGNIERGKADSIAATRFRFVFQRIQLQSWGSFTASFRIADQVPFCRTLCVHPLDWNMLYLKCHQCSHLVPSGLAVPKNTNLTVNECTIQCMVCGEKILYSKEDLIRIEPPSHTIAGSKEPSHSAGRSNA